MKMAVRSVKRRYTEFRLYECDRCGYVVSSESEIKNHVKKYCVFNQLDEDEVLRDETTGRMVM